MTTVTRFFDWLDEAAGGMIRLAYLLAGITAVAVYFGAGHLPPLIEDVLNATLPWSLAFAIETHTYITARRVRLAWQDRQSAGRQSDEYRRACDAMKVNLAILAVLLAFSAWNQLNYLYETWTPPATALALPGWSAYIVRALVIPCAFMAAAFLAPSAAPVAAQVDAEARATLADVFSIARKQRRKLIRQAERDGRDMTGALVELVEDPAARRIIAHAYGAIRPSERSTSQGGRIQGGSTPNPYPTGPGSPQSAPGGISMRSTRRPAVPQLPQTAREQRPAAQASGRRRRGAVPQSVEPQARMAWDSGARSIEALQREAGISRAAAQKYVAKFTAMEQAGQAVL